MAEASCSTCAEPALHFMRDRGDMFYACDDHVCPVGKDSLPLTFMVDPLPHFEVEVYDARGRRIDVPAGAPPKLKSWKAVRAATRGAQVTLDTNGDGHVALGWDANRLRWAPEKARGAIGADYPRAAAGPLPRGRYTVRIVTSLNGATNSDAPTTTIDVGR